MEKIGAPYAWAARTELRCKKCNESRVFYGEDIDERERWKDLHFKDGKLVCSGKYAPDIRSQVEDILALGRPDAPMQLTRNAPVDGTATLTNGNGEVVAEIDARTGLIRGNPLHATTENGQLVLRNEHGLGVQRVDITQPIDRGTDWRMETVRMAEEYVGRRYPHAETSRPFNPTASPYLRPVLDAYQREADNALSNSDFEQLPEGDRPSPAFIDFMNDLLREVSMCDEHTRRVLASRDMQHALAGLPRQSR